MAWVRKRTGADGRPRYQATYRDARDRKQVAGTFATKKEAERAAYEAEAAIAAGRLGGAEAGKRPFKTYVDDIWFPHHVLEPSTREGYRYTIDKHLIPFFGSMRTSQILPSHVREWVTDRVAAGVSPATIRHAKIVLSAIFTTALNDGVIPLHPCKGVKSPTVPRKEFRIVTPEQFESIYAALPDPQARLLVEVAIDSGMRWGELIARTHRFNSAGSRSAEWPTARVRALGDDPLWWVATARLRDRFGEYGTVGTALVDALAKSLDAQGQATAKTVGAVADLVASLAQGVHSARQAAE